MKGLRVLPLLCLLLAAGPADAQSGKPAGTLRGVFISDPPTLDPSQATDTTSSAVVRQLFDTLVELDEKLRPGPGLAERWTVSADHRVYTFALRPGVTRPPSSRAGRPRSRAGASWTSAPSS